MSKPRFRSAIRRPRTAPSTGYTPRAVGIAYSFPMELDGAGYVGGIIELGGGYRKAQMQQWFADSMVPMPTFVDVNVGSGSNKPDGPDGADGEVQLDMQIAGAIAPAATWRVYFCGNTDSDFLAGLERAARECDGVTISWGGPEDQWSASSVKKFNDVIARARTQGIPVFAAAGDNGCEDGADHAVVDFPASAPDTIGCGGTRLVLGKNCVRDSEVVWDDNDTTSATGGGVSVVFPGRQVPDCAGNADPDTGYLVSVDGQKMTIGGTSAVAPLLCGLHALLWQGNGGVAFDMLGLMEATPSAFFDVTQGDNGKYRAGPGRDDTTGLGVPNGTLLAAALAAMAATTVTTVTGSPAPTAPPTAPTGDGLAGFPTKTVQEWLNHRHTHTQVEAAAARSLIAWANENGIPLQ